MISYYSYAMLKFQQKYVSIRCVNKLSSIISMLSNIQADSLILSAKVFFSLSLNCYDLSVWKNYRLSLNCILYEPFVVQFAVISQMIDLPEQRKLKLRYQISQRHVSTPLQSCRLEQITPKTTIICASHLYSLSFL